MGLLFFWIKIAIKRLLDLSKPYLVVILCALMFIGAFIYAFINGHIVINFDIKTIYIVFSLIIFLSLINSFKNYHLMQILIKYSKCKYQNRVIYRRYLLKQALINNSLLIIFNIIAYYSIINYSTIKIVHIFILFGITVFSIFLSFIIMCVKNNYLNEKNPKTNSKILKINPLVKSALYDYLSSDFLITLILSIVIFIAFIINIAKGINNIDELKNNSNFFMIITIIFSVGFTGIVSSIPNINWKFQAIISPNSINYHLKRTFLVLAVFFGWLILLFIIFGGYVNITLTIKYLYCIFVLSCITVNLSFSITNVMIKMFTITIITILTVWVTALPSGFLPILLIPAIITFTKAKNEYREWSLL